MDGVDFLSNDLHDREDHIDVLVNNAGVGTGGFFDRITSEEWDTTMNLNLKSPFFLTRALHDLLKAKRKRWKIPPGSLFTSFGPVRAKCLPMYSPTPPVKMPSNI